MDSKLAGIGPWFEGGWIHFGSDELFWITTSISSGEAVEVVKGLLYSTWIGLGMVYRFGMPYWWKVPLSLLCLAVNQELLF